MGCYQHTYDLRHHKAVIISAIHISYRNKVGSSCNYTGSSKMGVFDRLDTYNHELYYIHACGK